VKQIFKNPLDAYSIETIDAGTVVQEVSETGSVRATDEVSLSFKNIGKVRKINVSVGEVVKKGDVLAELDSSGVLAQIQSAQAALSSASNQYDKLVNGSTQEYLKPYYDAVTAAEHNLQSAYDDSFSTLGSAYTKIYNVYNLATSLQYDYFSAADQPSIKVKDSKDDVNKNMQAVNMYLSRAEKSKNQDDIDTAILQTITALNNVYSSLQVIRDQCDQGTYYSSVSAVDKTSVDTQKTYINTIIGTVVDLQQSVSSYKIALQTAKNNLASQTANPRQEDLQIYQSQIDQARANVNLYQSQLNDNYIYSPIDGKITAVNAKIGETVSYSGPVINLLSLDPFQIKVDVYEQDIVNVEPGNSVKINLVAFPKETFEGKVLSIDPAEKIVDNVVYYAVTIDFPNQPEGVRSGMTADIVIEAGKKDNVVRITKNAVEIIDNSETVQFVNGKKIESRDIKTGLEGTDYYEVISGLNAGDMIVTGTK